MSKSLFGAEQEAIDRTTQQSDKNRNYVSVKLVILEVLTNYRQLEDLNKADRSFIEEKLLYDEDFYLKVNSGIHFFVVTENQEYALIPCPISEAELRCVYGSDANLIGRVLEVETLNKEIHAIRKRNIRFLNNEKDNLEDNDRYLPLNICNMFGSSSSATVKRERFKVNLRSGKGVFNVE